MSAIGRSWNKLLKVGLSLGHGSSSSFLHALCQVRIYQQGTRVTVPLSLYGWGFFLCVFFVRNNLSGRRHVHFCVETWAMTSVCVRCLCFWKCYSNWCCRCCRSVGSSGTVHPLGEPIRGAIVSQPCLITSILCIHYIYLSIAVSVWGKG